MALGGMRDHVGGGFHRYSVDGEWRVPHFEKMLYDQAQLVLAYLEAAQATGEAFFAQVAEDTLQYVARELTSPAGGFLSAEDADSRPPARADDPAAHPVEGAFYTWSAPELASLLGGDYQVVALRFGVEDGGNAPSDPHGEFTGLNLLHTARSVEDVAQATGRAPEAIVDALAHARLVLYEARLARPRPHLDDKVLAAWNGLTIAAFARAARVLRAERFGLTDRADRHLAAAERAARFLRTHLWDERRRVLLRRYRDGDAGIDGYAEDYAAVAFGLLELFQAGGDPGWLEWADQLQTLLDDRFWDAEAGGWFSTSGSDPSVLLRLKEDYDGAEPSAGALATVNLQVLTHLGPDRDREQRIERALSRFGPRLGDAARVVPFVLTALEAWHAGLGQIVVASGEDRDGASRLRAELAAHYRPFAITLPLEPAAAATLADRLPFIAPLTPRHGQATAYVCRDFACRQPVTTAEELGRLV